ncbi:MAG: COX15/CtaA family protein [Actinomycetota bacterium]|nr:COX15/CtaA family protein [Actinomycetota bacterium]
MGAVLGRLLSPTAATVRALALASVVANLGIVVTGGAVRLTASGLGCPTWPSCTDDSWTPTQEYGLHGLIEFGNRLLTYVLVAVALATLVAAWRHRPVRQDWQRLAVVLFLGIPAQGVIGGVTVLTDLNPWVVMLHFLCSMVLIGLATVLLARTQEPEGPSRLLVHPLLHRLAVGTLGVLVVVLYLGTVLTGSGPHAGDADARRTGLDPLLMSQLHADGVFLLVGLTVALLVALHAGGAPSAARRAAAVLLALELAQGTVGYLQLFTGLPVVLVAVHMLGAGLLVVAAVRAVLALRSRATPAADVPRPALAGSARNA